jgi:thioredoxin 1
MAHPADVQDATFEKEVLQNSTPTLVDFWAPWCGPCRMVAPIVEEIAGEYDGKLNVRKMNTDENLQVPGRFGITGLPTLVVFKNGEEVARIVGARPKSDVKRHIDAVLGADRQTA